MLHQWVLLVSAVIVVLSYSEHRVHAQFFGRGIGFQKRNPFKPHFGFHRKPHLGWVLAANPNAHEDDDDQAIKSRSAGEAGYDDEALQVVHSGDHVEELHDLGLEPSALIGFFNEDGTVGEWPLVEEHDGAEEMVGRKHGKLDCDDVFGRHSKKKRKFCRKMAAYNEDHGYDHHDDYGHHDSYGHGGHKHHGHHKHHGRYRRQLPSYLPNLPVQQLPLGPLTQSVPNPLQQLPVPPLPALPRSSRTAYRRYKRNLPYLGNPPLPLGQLPLGTPPLEQSVPVSSTVQLLPVQHITQVDRPRLIRNSPNPDPTPLQRLAQVKFLDANGSEMLAPYQLQSHHHEQHVCPAGTVANYNFFHFSCPPSVSSIDGGAVSAALRNHPKRYIDTNAWSQFPHRIEKRKGVELEQLAQTPVNVERVFSLTTTETVPEVSTTEASRTTESAAKESLRKPPRRKTLPTRSNKIFQRKLIQWRLQNIRDKADETTLEPIVVLSSRESVEEGAPVNRLRDTRDSNVHPISVIEMGDETGEDRLRSRPRPHSNRGEQFLNRLFAPVVPHPSPFDPPKRAAPQSTPSRNNRRGEKLVSRYLKARQPTTTTTVRTTTTPEPTTTTTTTTLRTTLTSKRFPHNKPNTDDASRRRTRYRLRPKKSIQDDEYETFGRNTLQTDPIVSRKSEPTKRRPVPPRRPFRLGKIKPLKMKQQPAREPAVTESLVKQGRWEEIFAIKTNENQRNHPRRSVVDAGEPQEVGQQDARWRLKRAQQFIRRQLRNWRTADQEEVTTTTTTSTTTTTARPLLKEGEDRRHRRPVRPVGRQGRQRSESSEVVNLGRYDVNGQLQAASSNQEGVLSPKVREYIASKVKEACDSSLKAPVKRQLFNTPSPIFPPIGSGGNPEERRRARQKYFNDLRNSRAGFFENVGKAFQGIRPRSLTTTTTPAPFPVIAAFRKNFESTMQNLNSRLAYRDQVGSGTAPTEPVPAGPIVAPAPEPCTCDKCTPVRRTGQRGQQRSPRRNRAGSPRQRPRARGRNSDPRASSASSLAAEIKQASPASPTVGASAPSPIAALPSIQHPREIANNFLNAVNKFVLSAPPEMVGSSAGGQQQPVDPARTISKTVARVIDYMYPDHVPAASSGSELVGSVGPQHVSSAPKQSDLQFVQGMQRMLNTYQKELVGAKKSCASHGQYCR